MSEKNANNIEELRSILFDTLRGVKAGEIDNDRAKMICDTAQTITNTVKAEIEYGKVFGGNGTVSGFIPAGAKAIDGRAQDHRKISSGTVTSINGVTTHRME